MTSQFKKMLRHRHTTWGMTSGYRVVLLMTLACVSKAAVHSHVIQTCKPCNSHRLHARTPPRPGAWQGDAREKLQALRMEYGGSCGALQRGRRSTAAHHAAREGPPGGQHEGERQHGEGNQDYERDVGDDVRNPEAVGARQSTQHIACTRPQEGQWETLLDCGRAGLSVRQSHPWSRSGTNYAQSLQWC